MTSFKHISITFSLLSFNSFSTHLKKFEKINWIKWVQTTNIIGWHMCDALNVLVTQRHIDKDIDGKCCYHCGHFLFIIINSQSLMSNIYLFIGKICTTTKFHGRIQLIVEWIWFNLHKYLSHQLKRIDKNKNFFFMADRMEAIFISIVIDDIISCL